jgi:GrpB-like predicted nucleotidyltransferase (UPF0157 family)
MRITEIVPWTEDWSKLYHIESQKIANIMNDEMSEIHHIGSTSVKQIGYAKPIIDILVVVKSIHNVDKYNEQMECLGYKPRGENGIPNRRYFIKGGDQRTHHVHCHQFGDEKIHAHLAFKQYMVEHADDAKAYGELKLTLAAQFPNDIHLYQSGKESFLSEMVNNAVNGLRGETLHDNHD